MWTAHLITYDIISMIDFFENLIAGYKLIRKIPAKAINSQLDITRIVKADTTGLVVRIKIVAIVPKEVPTAKAESNTVRL